MAHLLTYSVKMAHLWTDSCILCCMCVQDGRLDINPTIWTVVTAAFCVVCVCLVCMCVCMLCVAERLSFFLWHIFMCVCMFVCG